MLRFHKKVYFPIDSNIDLKNYTKKLNTINWQYTRHSVNNLKYRVYDIKAILQYIKDLKLDYKAIFEYYASDTGDILKAVYRVKYNNTFDLILVISENKTLVTVYSNSVGDNHDTLDKTQYVKISKS